MSGSCRKALLLSRSYFLHTLSKSLGTNTCYRIISNNSLLYCCVYIPCASKSSIIMLSACLGVMSAISFAFESSFFVLLLVPFVAFLFGMFIICIIIISRARRRGQLVVAGVAMNIICGGRAVIKWLLLGSLLLELDLLAYVL